MDTQPAGLTCLLSFFDEQPYTLHRLIRSLPLADVDRLVALDGRYLLFPSALTQSPLESIDAIRDACEETGITLTLEQPHKPFEGGEIEKRTRLFQLGETVTDPHEFYLIGDADEEITQAPADLHERLRDTTFDVAETMYDHPGEHTTFPKFFRAIRGLHVRANHYTYTTPDGRNLWGNAHTMRLEPRTPIHDMTITHHTKQGSDRTPERRVQRVAYYERRDALRVEQHHLRAAVA